MVTVFLSISNQMKYHFVQNRKEICHHDHTPFNSKENGNIFSECMNLSRTFDLDAAGLQAILSEHFWAKALLPALLHCCLHYYIVACIFALLPALLHSCLHYGQERKRGLSMLQTV